jgi:hypothetical protein
MAMQLAPEGHYYGKVVKQDIYSTKPNGEGTPFLGFDCLLTSRDDEFGKPSPLEMPLRRRFSLWLNAKNIKNTASSLRFLGFTDPDIGKLNPYAENPVSLVGVEVALDISHKVNEQTDELQENIWLSRAKKPLDKESSASVLSKAAELFKAYQEDYLEKKVSKLSDEEIKQAMERADKKAKEGETFNPPDFDLSLHELQDPY